MVRRIHQIPSKIWLILFWVCQEFVKAHSSKKLIVDSFPMAVCQNHKIFRCKLLNEERFRGYTASKKSDFFGIKVHMIVTSEDLPLEFLFTPGSSSDISAFRHFQFDRLKKAKVYGDGAYMDHQFEGFLKKAYQIELVPKRKKNSVRKNTSEDEYLLRFAPSLRCMHLSSALSLYLRQFYKSMQRNR